MLKILSQKDGSRVAIEKNAEQPGFDSLKEKLEAISSFCEAMIPLFPCQQAIGTQLFMLFFLGIR